MTARDQSGANGERVGGGGERKRKSRAQSPVCLQLRPPREGRGALWGHRKQGAEGPRGFPPTGYFYHPAFLCFLSACMSVFDQLDVYARTLLSCTKNCRRFWLGMESRFVLISGQAQTELCRVARWMPGGDCGL